MTQGSGKVRTVHVRIGSRVKFEDNDSANMSLKGRCGRLISSEESFRATGIRHPKAAVDFGGASEMNADLTFPVNTRVLIQGLQNAPQYNGQDGTVESFDEGRGRYIVRLGDGSTIALKPGNVVPVSAGTPVEPNESCLSSSFDPALVFVEVSFSIRESETERLLF